MIDSNDVQAVGTGPRRVWYYMIPRPITIGLGYEVQALRFSRHKAGNERWVAEVLDQYGRVRGQTISDSFKGAIKAGDEWLTFLCIMDEVY